MKYLPPNTLRYFQDAPHFQQYDLSQLPVSALSASTKEYRQNCGQAKPNELAFNFYALNHCAAIVRRSFTPNEPLPGWALEIMQDYMGEMIDQSKRMLHYIMSITTREMRHLHTGSVGPNFWPGLETLCGSKMVGYLHAITQLDETAAVARYMNDPPEATVGQYITCMSYGFHKGKWSSNFGGKKWGVVADAAADMLHGKTSMEMLVDVGFQLSHNGGPIFNKGMMYKSYTQPAFEMILDIQRGGQIPELVLDPESYGIDKPPLAVKDVQLVAKEKPEEFRGWVDWAVVKQLGAVAKAYNINHLIQQQAHKVPVEPPKPVVTKIDGQPVIVTGQWAVWPGVNVNVYQRVAS